MPLTVGEAPAFIAMIKAANKSLSIPDCKTTYDLLFSKKNWGDTQAKMQLGIKVFLNSMWSLDFYGTRKLWSFNIASDW